MKTRKMLSVLVLTIMLSLVNLNAMAAEASIKIEKSNYGPYAEITVNFTSVSEEMAANGAWVGVAEKKGNYLKASEYWTYLTTSSGKVVVRAPMNKGDYELRLYKDKSSSAESILQRIAFSVTSTLPQAKDDKLDYSQYVSVDGSWNGTYDTNWGEMVLTESNGVVSGTYVHDEGRISGTVKTKGIVEGTWSEAPNYEAPHNAGEIVFFMLEGGNSFVGYWRYGNEGDWHIWEPARRSKATFNSSDWAKAEVEKAYELGLVPDCLKDVDLTADITRAEFAAVSVKAYELLANTTALPAVNNPFTDTNDLEVLKAYNTGITTGVSATEFEPDALLNREQAATMLTRVFKRATLVGWTIATDAEFSLSYEKPTPFADDNKISSWAKDSVYFMAANGIINGVGNNNFAPQNITTEEEAIGYANATREQALLIAVRMVENLK